MFQAQHLEAPLDPLPLHPFAHQGGPLELQAAVELHGLSAYWDVDVMSIARTIYMIYILYCNYCSICFLYPDVSYTIDVYRYTIQQEISNCIEWYWDLQFISILDAGLHHREVLVHLILLRHVGRDAREELVPQTAIETHHAAVRLGLPRLRNGAETRLFGGACRLGCPVGCSCHSPKAPWWPPGCRTRNAPRSAPQRRCMAELKGRGAKICLVSPSSFTFSHQV